MAVQKTESRIPLSLTADDLGQAVLAADGKSALISMILSPLATNRANSYVVLITDGTQGTAAQGYSWSVAENGAAPTVQATPTGEFSYTPLAEGTLAITVSIQGSGSTTISTITMNQDIVVPSPELEELIETSVEQPGPGIGNPAVARELVNDFNPYYQGVTLTTPETGEAFKRFVFSMLSAGSLIRNPAERKQLLDQLATSINSGAIDFVSAARPALGAGAVRPLLLAMMLPSMLPWTELPGEASPRAAAEAELMQQVAALDDDKKIDLYNLIRFPKTNIQWCAKILEKLRDQYFNGTNFNDVLTGMSGTRAHWIVRHYQEGPISH